VVLLKNAPNLLHKTYYKRRSSKSGKRQFEFLGHVIRKNNLEDLSLSGRFEEKHARGRQRITYLDNFKDVGCLNQPRNLWDTARQRINWRKLQLMKFEHHVRQRSNRL